ncbi:MAG TPA: hypothetical protein PKI93_01925 [Alphaproteobacteria bacterium]|nr:hypothetical protein [Alphaproteobacteria bacterium]HNS43939.1 hypothetical protein [Alphaproteobacteria bacterium]
MKNSPFIILGFALILGLSPLSAYAGDVSPFEECATLRNMSDQSIIGVIRTAPFKTTTGTVQRHEGTFRLEPDQAAQVCSTGPFYDGYKVELVLRTIIPLFSCKTRLSGDIMLRKTTTKEGFTKLYADCK